MLLIFRKKISGCSGFYSSNYDASGSTVFYIDNPVEGEALYTCGESVTDVEC
jgi:hypothetical protein